MGPLFCLRPRMPHSRRRLRRLQGPLQSRRHADGPLGLRGRRPVRSHREEALLPRRARFERVQLRDARLRPQVRLLPELGQLAGAARSRGGNRDCRDHFGEARAGCAPLRRPRHGQHLQRAAHHDRMGSGGLQAGASGRAAHRVRVERPRHAEGAGVPGAVDRPVQSRPERIRPAAVPELRRAPRAGARHHPVASCARHLARGGDAAGARRQQLRRGAREAHRVSCRRVARHPVARDRVSPRLQDDGPRRHHAGHAAPCRGHRETRRFAIRLRGQCRRPRRRPREHRLSRVPRDARRAARVLDRAPAGSRRKAAARRAGARFPDGGARTRPRRPRLSPLPSRLRSFEYPPQVWLPTA